MPNIWWSQGLGWGKLLLFLVLHYRIEYFWVWIGEHIWWHHRLVCLMFYRQNKRLMKERNNSINTSISINDENNCCCPTLDVGWSEIETLQWWYLTTLELREEPFEENLWELVEIVWQSRTKVEDLKSLNLYRYCNHHSVFYRDVYVVIWISCQFNFSFLSGSWSTLWTPLMRTRALTQASAWRRPSFMWSTLWCSPSSLSTYSWLWSLSPFRSRETRPCRSVAWRRTRCERDGDAALSCVYFWKTMIPSPTCNKNTHWLFQPKH